jgi:D-alanine-D-alanine ligase-like ATP-grasp enzyme
MWKAGKALVNGGWGGAALVNPGGRVRLICVSARQVIAALDPDRYEIEPVAITKDGRWVRADEATILLSRGLDHLPDALLPNICKAGKYGLVDRCLKGPV